jgi:AAA+ ATPase superfamily predicted ATPase
MVAALTSWGFYGRRDELHQLQEILKRRRWFFLQISGRRRIGKTTLIKQALQNAGITRSLYIQIPDSDPAGVVAACNGYLELFGSTERISSLNELARLIGNLARDGYVIALDEFQYFRHKHLSSFCSLLQAEVDQLAAQAHQVPGGLVVLGSLHTDMTALLEDRSAPLYNRTTDRLELGHLDIASLLEMLRTHTEATSERLLFLWALFEGVPKFYRDAFEQQVLNADRHDFLQRMFFSSSSPLQGEADNWFLRELRGRYDMVLQYLSRHPGCTNADIEQALASASGPGDAKQIGGHLKVLSERYRMIERRLPILSPTKARRGRYYIRDNFLSAWLSALQRPVSAMAFRPVEMLIAQANRQLEDVEGHALENLVGQLYEERSRRSLGDFPVSERIRGYWDRSDVEIDLVAINEDEQRVRFATCKRNPDKLMGSITSLKRASERFLDAYPRFRSWRHEWIAVAPEILPDTRQLLEQQGMIAESLTDLTKDL